ncbi:hypothetical protein PBI_GRAYSON_195 [Rhodococcus phage Grayson]|nr:hypothetical protein PBI_GRAYSON_195 [Rhodococcus phage Grayson]
MKWFKKNWPLIFALMCVAGVFTLLFVVSENQANNDRKKREAELNNVRLQAICEERGGLWINDECLQKDSIVKIEVK